MTDEEQKKIFANNLNRYISLNQKQQIDVAKDLGINPTTFNMWCKGNSMPNVGNVPKSDKMRKIAEYLNVSVDYLMTGKEVQFIVETAQKDVLLTEMPRRIKEYALKLAEMPKEKQEQIMSLIDMLEDRKDK